MGRVKRPSDSIHPHPSPPPSRGRELDELIRVKVKISGVVQGVGFRPFVYRLAVSRGLRGSVVNTSAGVLIDVEGSAPNVEEFLRTVHDEAPPNSRITGMEHSSSPPAGFASFEIGVSVASQEGSQPVSPDSCTCKECLSELFDPRDRRHRYPFINCTNCGPRFTIIEGLPYDRPLTSMKKFRMCPECLAEYDDPMNRRFHAEPNACPSCGPELWLADRRGSRLSVDDPLKVAAAKLREGAVVALKGLGGFQLACVANDDATVKRLRERKIRPDKPFAVMVGSAGEAALHCRVSAGERRLLESVERPIVLLERLPQSGISELVAPRLRRLGMMLPCAPLHFLLMAELEMPLVMTSGNLSDEPICRTNGEAAGRLTGIADFFLFHDRGIRSTYDDSVTMLVNETPVMLRRARGYAPLPVKLPAGSGSLANDSVLAAGGELKNTFCLTRGDQAFVSQHIGDLEDAETLEHYELTVALFARLFDAQPQRYACDSHPDYLSTIYSLEQTHTPLRVQHHRAHVASCLAENGFLGKAIGVALDGTGFGDDGRIWGGEFFVGSIENGFQRAAHLQNMPLPGGEAAIREPWRTALGATLRFAPEKAGFVASRLGLQAEKMDILTKQLQAGLNCSETSSCGRLFDAVAAMLLKRQAVSYEAQAAVELEALAVRPDQTNSTTWPGRSCLPKLSFGLDQRIEPWVILSEGVIRQIIGALEDGGNPADLAWDFQLALAEAIVHVSVKLGVQHGLKTVALSGGVFQNRILWELVTKKLADQGLEVLTHRQLPPNDGGLCFGQAAIAIQKTRS